MQPGCVIAEQRAQERDFGLLQPRHAALGTRDHHVAPPERADLSEQRRIGLWPQIEGIVAEPVSRQHPQTGRGEMPAGDAVPRRSGIARLTHARTGQQPVEVMKVQPGRVMQAREIVEPAQFGRRHINTVQIDIGVAAPGYELEGELVVEK